MPLPRTFILVTHYEEAEVRFSEVKAYTAQEAADTAMEDETVCEAGAISKEHYRAWQRRYGWRYVKTPSGPKRTRPFYNGLRDGANEFIYRHKGRKLPNRRNYPPIIKRDRRLYLQTPSRENRW